MREVCENKGALFEYKFRTSLQPLVDKYGWLLANDVKIKSRRSFAQIDFVLFTLQGYFCIEVKDWNCKVHCEQSTFWQVEYPERSFRVLSPLVQNNAHYNSLNRLVPGYRIKTVVCFSEDSDIVNQPDNVFHLSQFVDYLTKVSSQRVIVTEEEMINDFLIVMRESAICTREVLSRN